MTGGGSRSLPVLDDGRGQIMCPKKGGAIALPRCREFQSDTAATGKACTCEVYRAYADGRPDPSLGPVPKSELMCGRELPAAALAPKPRKRKRVAHAAHGERCKKCRNFSPLGTNLFGGLCHSCRQQQRTCTRCSSVKARRQLLRDGLCALCQEQPVRGQKLLPVVAESVIETLKASLLEQTRENTHLRERVHGAERTLKAIKRHINKRRAERRKPK